MTGQRLFATLFTVLLIVAGWGAIPVRSESSLPPDDRTTPAPSMPVDKRIRLVLDTSETTTRVWIRPPAGLLSPARPASATVSVTYIPNGDSNAYDACEAWPADAQVAFNYAAFLWANLINSPVPITISACWYSDTGSTLGYNYVGLPSANFPGAPQANTYYAPALANARAGYDLAPGAADTNIAINKNFTWYKGTDGNVPVNQIDMVSVVMHEIAHGLGFSGGMRYSGGTGSWAGTWPFAYDRFTETGGNTWLVSIAQPSTQLGSALTSNDLYFDGTNANAASGGTRVKIYAPSTWMSGSSYSHLDYDTYRNTSHRLMVYALADGVSVHDPGSITMGIFKDLGWTTLPDVSIVKSIVGEQDPAPGESITFTLTISNASSITATNVVVTDIVPSQVTNLDYSSSRTITRTGVLTYVWSLGALGMGQNVVITITGQVSATLPSDYAIVNTASVSDPQDATPANNTSSVIVGGEKVFLPLVMKDYQAPGTWSTILGEDFEGAFPGAWQVSDNDGSTYGTYYWAKRNCRTYAGSYSGWGVGGGANGGSLGCGSNYPNYADSWMVYGPFSLANATAADLSYKLWLNSEITYDKLCRYASTNGTNFYGTCTSGNTAGWTDKVLDLAAVPTLGNLVGQANVWIAIRFSSDYSNVYPEGAYVDNIVLRKCTGGLCTAQSMVVSDGKDTSVETSAMMILPR